MRCAVPGDSPSLTLAAKLESFLSNPQAALAAPAFSPVLDALSGRLTEAEAEQEAARALARSCESLVRNAYEAWAYYGVIAELRPRRFWAVASFDGDDVRAVETDEVVAGWQAASPDRRVPEAVFQTEDGRLFAMKSEAARELDYYGFAATRGRDTSAGGNTPRPFGPSRAAHLRDAQLGRGARHGGSAEAHPAPV